MEKPKPTPTSTPWFNLAFLNALDPILKVILGVITLIGALYGFISVIVDFVGWLRPPRLDIYMSDVVWPVAEPDNEIDFAINVQFAVYNPGTRMVALRRLEAELVRPSWTTFPEKKFPLEWYGLIKGSPSGFEDAEPVVVKPIPGHELEVLGVQLRGRYDRKDSSRAASFDWFLGEYILRLYAYINVSDTPMELSPRSGFRFKLTDALSAQLSPTGQLNSVPARLVNLSGRQRK